MSFYFTEYRQSLKDRDDDESEESMRLTRRLGRPWSRVDLDDRCRTTRGHVAVGARQ